MEAKERDVIIAARGVAKSYRRGLKEIAVLDGLDLNVCRGEFLVIMGPSGSGKTTLLNLLAGVDRVSSGRIVVNDICISELSDRELTKWRAAAIGFVFQLYYLISVLTTVENVELPLILTGLTRAARRERAGAALKRLGLQQCVSHFPGQLSGGQLQRVAIARAIVTDPEVLVADEPTGDLDSEARDDVLSLLAELNRTLGKTIVLVTHDTRATEVADRVLYLDKGVLRPDSAPRRKSLTLAA